MSKPILSPSSDTSPAAPTRAGGVPSDPTDFLYTGPLIKSAALVAYDHIGIFRGATGSTHLRPSTRDAVNLPRHINQLSSV